MSRGKRTRAQGSRPSSRRAPRALCRPPRPLPPTRAACSSGSGSAWSRSAVRASSSAPRPRSAAVAAQSGAVAVGLLGAHLAAERDQLGEVRDGGDVAGAPRCGRRRARRGSRRAAAPCRRRAARTAAAGRSGRGSPRRSSRGRARSGPRRAARRRAASRARRRRSSASRPERALGGRVDGHRLPDVSEQRSQPPRPSARSPRRRGPARRRAPRTATAGGRRPARAGAGRARRSARCRSACASSKFAHRRVRHEERSIAPTRWTRAERRAALLEPGGPALELVVDARVAQPPQHREPGGRRERVPGERAGLVDGADRREQLHDLGPAAERRERQAAADDLAEHRQVGQDAVPLLRAAAGDAEAGDHLVEDQQRARDVAEPAQRLEVARLRRDDAHVRRRPARR